MANDLKIGESHPIDENLRPVKVGGEMTALELSTDKVRTKDLETNTLTASSFSPGTLSVSGDATIGGVIKFGSSNEQIYKVVGQDTIRFNVGGTPMMDMIESSAGNTVKFMNLTAVGFDQRQGGTLDATDSYITFKDCNKWTGTFPASNITDMHLIFPDASCNCTLLLKQDGTGSRTVTNWKTWDQTGAANESTVIWSGGSAPTLTTTANKIDILSFYWDNDEHKAYGVASLNF